MLVVVGRPVLPPLPLPPRLPVLVIGPVLVRPVLIRPVLPVLPLVPLRRPVVIPLVPVMEEPEVGSEAPVRLLGMTPLISVVCTLAVPSGLPTPTCRARC